MQHCKRRGFTLIELLVVIAIIAILAAILFPVFAKAKEKAKIGVCCEHQKQLLAAFHRYADDWNNMTCQTYDAPSAPGGRYWGQKLFPYTSKNPDIFYCGGLKNNHDRNELNLGDSFTVMCYTSIGLSIVVGDEPGGTDPVKLSEFGSPTRTLIFACSSLKNCEGIPKHDRFKGVYFVAPGKSTEPLLCKAPEIATVVDTRGWTCNFFDPERHSGSVVVGYLDGHVGVHTQNWVLTAHGTEVDVDKPNFSIWDRR